MALVQCQECGRQVSDRATACPQCGLPTRHMLKGEPRPPDRAPKETRRTGPQHRAQNEARRINTGLIIGFSVGGGLLAAALIALIVLIIVLASGGRRADQATEGRQSDYDLIQGMWINDLIRFEITAETMSGVVKGGPPSTTKYKLDPSKKPKTIDITPLSGPDKGVTILGIYALERDTLTICMGDEKRGRPTELKDLPGTNFFVLKRDKR